MNNKPTAPTNAEIQAHHTEAEQMYRKRPYVERTTSHIDRGILLRRLAEAEAMLERNRWNIDVDGSDIIVCKGEHEKVEGCREDRYIPEYKLKQAQSELSDMSQLCADYKAQAEQAQARLDAVGKLRTYGGTLTTHIEQGIVQRNDDWIRAAELEAALKGDKP